uniref:Uncharacterized protein n=1 Tax=Graphocephala atropunctata TaxID=36148 RepID=A0A1B6ML05_9HEMI
MSSSLVAEFNSRSTSQFAPRVRLEDLTDPCGHRVASFKEIISKYGRSVVAQVEVGDEVCDCFLPKRFNSALPNDKIVTYNDNPNLKLKYIGIGKYNEKIVELTE